jgi:hypothetical protein
MPVEFCRVWNFRLGLPALLLFANGREGLDVSTRGCVCRLAHGTYACECACVRVQVSCIIESEGETAQVLPPSASRSHQECRWVSVATVSPEYARSAKPPTVTTVGTSQASPRKTQYSAARAGHSDCTHHARMDSMNKPSTRFPPLAAHQGCCCCLLTPRCADRLVRQRASAALELRLPLQASPLSRHKTIRPAPSRHRASRDAETTRFKLQQHGSTGILDNVGSERRHTAPVTHSSGRTMTGQSAGP